MEILNCLTHGGNFTGQYPISIYLTISAASFLDRASHMHHLLSRTGNHRPYRPEVDIDRLGDPTGEPHLPSHQLAPLAFRRQSLPLHRQLRHTAAWLLCGVVVAGCGSDGGTGPTEFDRADLLLLYAPLSQNERATVLAEWEARDVAVHDVRIELRDTVAVGIDTLEVRILSHLVQGDRHYGALILPLDAASTPRIVLAYTHFSDVGVSVESTLFALGAVAGLRGDQVALVIPSFGGKSLSFGSNSWISEGPVSILDGEVDDTLALIHAAWQQPGVIDGQAATIGFSAGGTIALLTAIREPGVRRVVDFFAPVDFFGPFAQQLLLDILDDQPPELASIPVLQASLIDPFERGELSVAQMRLELLRRSALHFASSLPLVLAHHGTADRVVHRAETEALVAAVEAVGGSIQAYYYSGGDHNPFSLDGSLARTAAFLGELAPVAEKVAATQVPPWGGARTLEGLNQP